MSADYYAKVANGSYDLVSAGEVCSIDTAKQLGIYDKANHFAAGYAKDTKTFTKRDDPSVQQNELCTQTDNAKTAYPLCMSQHQFGFVRKRGFPNKCITADCPSGFTEERPGVCKKPLEDAKLSQRAKCEERWYDWFMIPNYHAGNKYLAPAPGQCLAPCPPGHIPAYAQDPVDGANVDFTSKDDQSKCVPRTDYFGGKYVKGSEYCPIAWVTRMNATPEFFRQKTKEQMDRLLAETGGRRAAGMDKADASMPAKTQALSKQAASMFEEVTLTDEAVGAACKQLNTAERLEEAYAVCKSVQDDEGSFARKLEEEAGDDENAQFRKIAVIKHACNALLCNQDIDPYVADSIGREPICFAKPAAVDQGALDADDDNRKPPNSDEGKQFVRKSVGYAMYIIFIGIVGIFAIFATTRFIWPKIVRPLSRFLKRLLTGWKSSERGDDVAEMIDKIGKPRNRT